MITARRDGAGNGDGDYRGGSGNGDDYRHCDWPRCKCEWHWRDVKAVSIILTSTRCGFIVTDYPALCKEQGTNQQPARVGASAFDGMKGIRDPTQQSKRTYYVGVRAYNTRAGAVSDMPRRKTKQEVLQCGEFSNNVSTIVSISLRHLFEGRESREYQMRKEHVRYWKIDRWNATPAAERGTRKPMPYDRNADQDHPSKQNGHFDVDVFADKLQQVCMSIMPLTIVSKTISEDTPLLYRVLIQLNNRSYVACTH